MEGNKMKIGIIGAGNLGKAIIDGLMAKSVVPGVSSKAEQDYRGIKISSDNRGIAKKSEVIILTVKPSEIDCVLKEIKAECKGKMLISFAAGLRMSYYEKRADAKIVRAMTNIAASENLGFSVYSCRRCNEADKEKLSYVLGILGKAFETEDESLIDAATSISASGIAYLILILQCFIDCAMKNGFNEKIAKEIVLETATAGARLLKRDTAENLLESIASKGGTTE